MNYDTTSGELKTSSLTTADIVFFVVAAAAPLGATLGAVPAVFAIGGAGAPGLYLIASAILMFFAIGFAAMSRYVISAGGFAELINRGLGKTAGHAAAGVALLAYICMLSGIYGQFGAFGADLVDTFTGGQSSWQFVVLVGVAMVAIFGYLEIDLSARILGVLLVLEVLIIAIFDIAVLMQTDARNFNFTAFMPTEIFSPGMGVALMFAFACFVGFESTTLYGEEAKKPHRTVPMATYIAIAIIGIFYTFTAWCLGLAYADVDVQNQAATDMVGFVFDANTRFVGEWSTYLMQFLVITSVFAVLLSFHNALCRYLYSLARSNFLPNKLSKIHDRYRSPYIASATLSVVTSLVLIAFMVGEAHPLDNLFLWMVGLGTLSVLVLQTLGAAAVVGFFYKRGKGIFFQGIVSPLIGGLGLLSVAYLAVTNFGELSGAQEGLASNLPWVLPIVVILAIINGRRQSIKSSSQKAPAIQTQKN